MAFNPDMLTLARELGEISQTQLAEKLGVTQGFISKVENGLSQLPDDLLQKAAAALGRPRTFFLREDTVYGLPATFHRRRADVSKRKLARVHAIMNEYRIHLKTLLKSADIEAVRALPELDLDLYGTAEVAAQTLRGAWLVKSGPIKNLLELVESAGVVIVPVDLRIHGVDAAGWRVPDAPPLIFVDRNAPVDRLRFSVAHELGHLVMHRMPSPDMEIEANRFAAEFLMPAADIRRDLVGVDLPRLALLKRVWRVSIQALLKRATDLERITERQARRLWMQISAKGFRVQEPINLEPETAKVLRMVVDAHIDNMGYSLAELARILCLPDQQAVVDYYYPDSRPHLQLVN